MVLTFILSTFSEALQDNSEGFIRPLYEMLYNSYVVCFFSACFICAECVIQVNRVGRKKEECGKGGSQRVVVA